MNNNLKFALTLMGTSGVCFVAGYAAGKLYLKYKEAKDADEACENLKEIIHEETTED